MKVNLDTIIIAYDIMQSSNPWLSEQLQGLTVQASSISHKQKAPTSN
jgi:hypothetical protein